MEEKVKFTYRFHPAGQGIFATGVVSTDDGGRKSTGAGNVDFHWVYDCGSTSKKHVESVAAGYKALVVDGKRLDALCISHLDYDHVSGLGALLDGLKVGTVVIPYYTPLERLLAGIRAGVVDADYFAFLDNPVGFLLERASSIERIVIVGEHAEEQDGPPFFADRDPEPEPSPSPAAASLSEQQPDGPNEKGKPWQLRFQSPSAEGAERAPTMLNEATRRLARNLGTELLHEPGHFALETGPSPGTPPTPAAGPAAMGVPGVWVGYWEFLFFHKPIDPSVLRELCADLAKLFVQPQGSPSAGRLSQALGSAPLRRKIKALYQSNLKRTKLSGKVEDINSTSVCMYAGPVPGLCVSSWMGPGAPEALFSTACHFPYFYSHGEGHCSLLYTGDANLKPQAHRRELRAFLNSIGELKRWQRIFILQVPHHGSSRNWETGSAGEFSHVYSVFCANEQHRRYKHPHREVIVDLLRKHPVLVNGTQGWSWRGAASFQRQLPPRGQAQVP